MPMFLDHTKQELILLTPGEAQPRIIRYVDIAEVTLGCTDLNGSEGFYIRFQLRTNPPAEHALWFGVSETQRNQAYERVREALRLLKQP